MLKNNGIILAVWFLHGRKKRKELKTRKFFSFVKLYKTDFYKFSTAYESLSSNKYILYIYLNSLNFRAHLIFAQSRCANKWLREITNFSRILLREIFLLKRGAKIRLRETGKRVKHLFCLNKTFL